MAKGGPLSFILPAALGAGALATGGLGLPALLGDVGAEAGVGAGTAALGDIGPAATAGLLGEGAPLAEGASLGATPLSAGALEAAAPGALDVSALSAGPLGAAGEAAGTLGGAIGPALDALGGNATTLSIAGDAGAGPASITAGAGATAPITGAPLGPIDAAGQPISSAVGAATDPGIVGLGTLPTTGGAEGAGSTFFVPGTDQALGTVPASSEGMFGGIGDALSSAGSVLKPVTALASAGLLGTELLKGNPQYPQQAALGNQAGQYLNLGNNLANPIQTGALPAGAQSAIDLGTAANKAKVASSFANLGLSGSTMEGEALGTVEQQAAAQKFGVADSLLQNALQYSQLGTQTTTNLLRTSMEEDQQYREALASFAKALAGTGASIGA